MSYFQNLVPCLAEDFIDAKPLNTEGIPWLFSNVKTTFWQWQVQVALGCQHWQTLESQVARELEQKNLDQVCRRRLEKMKIGYQHNANAFIKVFRSMLTEKAPAPNVQNLLQAKLPVQQRLLTYEQNLYRDWIWGEDENRQTMSLLEDIGVHKNSWGKTLVIGAGAGKLTMDCLSTFQPDSIIAVDINPYFLLPWQFMLQGESFELYEFPPAPIDDDHVCLKRSFSKLETPPNLSLCFADAANLPFREDSFDTIVTPWFIDIFYQDFHDFALTLNRLLKTEGQWINTGTLSFVREQKHQCYSPKEVVSIAEGLGLTIDKLDRRRIDYLSNPASCMARRELVTSFVAKKTQDVSKQPSEPKTLPDWLAQTSKKIPRISLFRNLSQSLHLESLILSQVNGHRSINDLSKLVQKEFNVSAEDAINTVADILLRVWEKHHAQTQQIGSMSA